MHNLHLKRQEIRQLSKIAEIPFSALPAEVKAYIVYILVTEHF